MRLIQVIIPKNQATLILTG